MSPSGADVRAGLREMETTTATGFVLAGVLLVFVVVRAVMRFMRRRADRARGVVRTRIDRILQS